MNYIGSQHRTKCETDPSRSTVRDCFLACLRCSSTSTSPHTAGEGQAPDAPARWCTRRPTMTENRRCSRVSRLSCLGRRRRWLRRSSKQENWVSLTLWEISIKGMDFNRERGWTERTGCMVCTGADGSGSGKQRAPRERIRPKSSVLRLQVPVDLSSF